MFLAKLTITQLVRNNVQIVVNQTRSLKEIKCKAAICWEPNKPLKIEEVTVAPPDENQVRIKMVATGICHTDAVTWRGEDADAVFPVVLGHEGSGIVESVGKNVKQFKAGDHVIPVFVPYCAKCKFCQSRKTNICDKIHDVPGGIAPGKGLLLNGKTPFSCKGKPVYNFMGTSTFSEYTVTDDIFVCKINKKAPLDKVCLLGCGVSTGYGAAINDAKVRPGSTCAVWGLGGVGLSVVMGCKRAGASIVCGIDINSKKCKIGQIFGITHFINPNETDECIKDYLLKLSNGGFDYTFESCGITKSMEDAMDVTHPGWGICTVMGVAPTGEKISTSPVNLIAGRKWIGSAYGGFNVTEIPALVNDYMSGNIKLDELITHTVTLENVNQAFENMFGGKGLRTVVKFKT
ncbi:alcohol dehydrogenase class-3-like isoform X1 [Teleopsis dalmanni]|uniref:alcohol dehydrogenase class-3-like isoform X1 n=1 Tax=Teleopsis dalmanni TaxID=139649 RepID=UPI000D32AB01|nr:alcohol dehydrogenase class-3-like isoform X1 [Teleopsis dalmanni]